MHPDLFGDSVPGPDDGETPLRRPPAGAPHAPVAPAPRAVRSGALAPAGVDDAVRTLATALPDRLRLGTSSWSYPGWQGLVWAAEHSESTLSRNGLPVYAQHPLLRTVSIDRGFYRPLSVSEYERYATQVPEDFRFVVKAPSVVTDALVRDDSGRGREPNPAFLSPDLARTQFVEPALQGLGRRLGALVFQLSPLAPAQLDRMPEQLERLRQMLRAQPTLAAHAPDGVIAVEVRDPQWLTPDLVAVLREAGATYCLGLHPKLPPLAEQLPLLRALWPGPLVCRWNLHLAYGPYGYADAERELRPYDQVRHSDPDTHAALARVVAGVTQGGQNAFVTISNHAEGCAPRTVHALAEHVATALAARL